MTQTVPHGANRLLSDVQVVGGFKWHMPIKKWCQREPSPLTQILEKRSLCQIGSCSSWHRVLNLRKKLKTIVLVAIVVVLVLLLLAKAFDIKTVILKKIYPKQYSEYVEKYSKEYNIDPLLIFSIIKAESNFDKNAHSSSGAQGLMQLMEATATEIANKIDEPLVEQESLLEPEKNIMIGVKYYSELLEMYDGNMLLALTAYNAGIGNVNGWIENGVIKKDGSDIENIPYKETNMYVRKIINNYKMYQKIYNY